jgi:cell division protein FtsZ
MIEDGLESFPPLSGSALLRTPPLPPSGVVPPGNHFFEPQAPAEFQRTSRRLPAIEDFPPQAQKEWNAHQTASAGGRSEQQEKPGLFGRLASLSRSVKSAQNKNDAHVLDDEDEPHSLPIFVGRERR